MSTMYAGVDLHSNSTTIAFITEEGEFFDSIQCPTEAKALKRAVSRPAADRLSVVLEQGGQACWAAQQLSEVADQVRICDPTENEAISGPGDKDDRHDARQLARLLRLGATKHLYRPRMDDRMRFRRRYAYYQQATEQVKRHIQYVKSQLRFWGARIRKRAGYSRRKMARWIGDVPAAVQSDMQLLADQIEQTLQWKKQAWHRLREAGADYWEIQQFQRIPGLGPVRAHGLSALLMDPHRFRSASALFKYCRLAVQRRSSGGEAVAPEQLNRAGHGQLKAIAHGAVRSAVFHQKTDNEVARFYRASLERTGGKAGHALLNTQRKLLKICWGLWKTETEYNPERFCSGSG